MAVSNPRHAATTASKHNVSTIIPQPAEMDIREGTFALTPDTVLVAEGAATETATLLAESLRPATGFTLPVAAQPGSARTQIRFVLDSGEAARGPEAYRMEVAPEAVTITAATPAGLFYGSQSFRHLLPPEACAAALQPGVTWSAPCCHIVDGPRFGWRGLMFDSGHDFQHLSFLYRFIDAMALYKFNLLHWHLTDLGTWAVEILKHPGLVDPATRGPEVKQGHYTQEQIRDVVRYAAARNITILPEIDMPGHAVPALLARPDLRCPNNERIWEYCVGNEDTFTFLEEVLDEILALFPSELIHIGGDECPKDGWKKCPRCKARMAAEGLKDEFELQSFFIRRIEKFLNSRGRRLIGWDEILEGGLAPGATVMSWRGIEGGVAAARAGHDIVMASNTHLYFDYPQTADRKTDHAFCHVVSSVVDVYGFEPIPPELTPDQARHVLGAQGQLWTDHHPTEEQLEWLTYPRACALAEITWSPAHPRNLRDFLQRLFVNEQRLSIMGIHTRPLSSILESGSFGSMGPFPADLVDPNDLVAAEQKGRLDMRPWVLSDDTPLAWKESRPHVELPNRGLMWNAPPVGGKDKLRAVVAELVSETDQTVDLQLAGGSTLRVLLNGEEIRPPCPIRLRAGINRIFVIGNAIETLALTLLQPGGTEPAAGVRAASPTLGPGNEEPYRPSPDRLLRKTLAGAWRARLTQKLPSAAFIHQAHVDPGISDAARAAVAPDAHDADWDIVQVPQHWEAYGGDWTDADGEAVFRRVLQIPGQWAGRDLKLSLAVLDDYDDTFWNGELIGHSDANTAPNIHTIARNYTVPGRLVKPGRTVLAVRIFDRFGQGGFMGEPDQLFVQPA